MDQFIRPPRIGAQNNMKPYIHQKHLIAAGLAGIVGLLTAIIYMVHSSPYTMILFLMFGQIFTLSAIIIFVYVVVRDIKANLESVVEKRFKQGEVIFRQGEIGDRVYVIIKGEVEVVREEAEKAPTILARLGPEEYFGEMALLRNAPRSATVRALTDVQALTIHQTHFGELFTHVPALRKSVESVMRGRS